MLSNDELLDHNTSENIFVRDTPQEDSKNFLLPFNTNLTVS